MKPHYYIILLLPLLLCLPQSGHAQSTQDLLIGSWSFDYDTSLNMMSQKSKAHYAKMSAIKKDRLSSTYKDRKAIFNSDGSYTQVLSDGRTANATWTINNSNNLEITIPNGKTIRFLIKNLGTNTLTLSQINTTGVSMNILFTNWHLTKN